jgi:type IV pilus assembly protein PilA
MKNLRLQAGFTLIELMIVVSIIGILSALAIPQYQDYVLRSRWSDNVSLVGQIKQAIAECSQVNNGVVLAGTCDTLPNLMASQFLPSNFVTQSSVNSKYLQVGVPVVVSGGTIIVVGSNLAGNCVVRLTPIVAPGRAAVRWDASTDPVPIGCGRSKTGVGI